MASSVPSSGTSDTLDLTNSHLRDLSSVHLSPQLTVGWWALGAPSEHLGQGRHCGAPLPVHHAPDPLCAPPPLRPHTPTASMST